MALTDQQMTDARRYLGYPLVGTTMPITPEQDIVYLRFGLVIMSLYTRLTTMTATEEATLIAQYLTPLATMETAIPGAGQNLDTAQAAVWTHNPNEVRDRVKLFDGWRRRMCDFLGCPPGPGLGTGGMTISRA